MKYNIQHYHSYFINFCFHSQFWIVQCASLSAVTLQLFGTSGLQEGIVSRAAQILPIWQSVNNLQKVLLIIIFTPIFEIAFGSDTICFQVSYIRQWF